MPKRLNTIIVVPHSKAKFIKFSFSTKSLILAGSVVLVALAFSVIAIAYSGSAVTRSAQVEKLRAENKQLVDVNQELEQTIIDVQARLDEFEERTARLALAAGMESEAPGLAEPEGRTQRLGSGGPYDRLPGTRETLLYQGDLISQQLDHLHEAIIDRDRLLSSKPSIAPVTGILTDGFGSRRDPMNGRRAFHRGVDISARRGTSVVTPADGVVIFAGRDGGFGKVIRISHGFGYTTVYGHLHRIKVKPGDEVKRNQEIGLLGSTGRSTGPHLHYEVHVDGRADNPLFYILNAF
jgi:murein DD-endopeptidase MepM/ murein hydrolase activator NlpD